ncbi:hypothetical protein RRG08_057964 [Elysia crispata]|uniref:EGF-like domain-containing protein n=1 Tax=Elysia crispata TaxID=231223 RepID=A0AAE1BDQ3_9GAST|nr:hypothetical protein RRG08_057964 [Elysia crispata]
MTQHKQVVRYSLRAVAAHDILNRKRGEPNCSLVQGGPPGSGAGPLVNQPSRGTSSKLCQNPTAYASNYPDLILRSGNKAWLSVPCKPSRKDGHRAFVQCAPVVWNALPLSIREASSIRVEDCKHCGENTNCIQQKGISGCFCKDADHAKCYDRKNCSLTDPAHKKCKSDCYFWTCQCKPGYLHDSKITSAYICKDINECTIQVGPHANRCGENTECENVGGSYLCACVSSGYVYNEKPPNILYCTDIDECLYKEGSHANECGANTRCFNTVGGYKCPCLSSGFYRVDDFSCKDKDECREKTHNCSSNSQCKNEPGSFRCECKDGYHQKDNFTCLCKILLCVFFNFL